MPALAQTHMVGVAEFEKNSPCVRFQPSWMLLGYLPNHNTAFKRMRTIVVEGLKPVNQSLHVRHRL